MICKKGLLLLFAIYDTVNFKEFQPLKLFLRNKGGNELEIK